VRPVAAAECGEHMGTRVGVGFNNPRLDQYRFCVVQAAVAMGGAASEQISQDHNWN